MRVEIFSAPTLQFAVFREADGSISWEGTYEGKQVRVAFPVDQGERCVILLDPDFGGKAYFKNLFCIKRDGGIAWIAELLQTHDKFIALEMGGDGLLRAWSWSAYMLTIEPTTGQ